MCGKNHAHGSWVCRLCFAALPLSAGHFEIQSEIAIASYNIKIVRVFSNHHKKQPALRFLNVQAAFYREKPSENYFSGGFEITGDMRISLDYEPSCVCCRLDYDMIWNHSVTTKNACVRTAHILHLNLKVCVTRR